MPDERDYPQEFTHKGITWTRIPRPFPMKESLIAYSAEHRGHKLEVHLIVLDLPKGYSAPFKDRWSIIIYNMTNNRAEMLGTTPEGASLKWVAEAAIGHADDYLARPKVYQPEN
jgi:hypothetical protein